MNQPDNTARIATARVKQQLVRSKMQQLPQQPSRALTGHADWRLHYLKRVAK